MQRRPVILRSLLVSSICYEVATISRLLNIIGLFCRISSLLQGSFAKETYNLEGPASRSHPIDARDSKKF